MRLPHLPAGTGSKVEYDVDRPFPEVLAAVRSDLRTETTERGLRKPFTGTIHEDGSFRLRWEVAVPYSTWRPSTRARGDRPVLHGRLSQSHDATHVVLDLGSPLLTPVLLTLCLVLAVAAWPIVVLSAGGQQSAQSYHDHFFIVGIPGACDLLMLSIAGLYLRQRHNVVARTRDYFAGVQVDHGSAAVPDPHRQQVLIFAGTLGLMILGRLLVVINVAGAFIAGGLALLVAAFAAVQHVRHPPRRLPGAGPFVPLPAVAIGATVIAGIAWLVYEVVAASGKS